MTQPIQRLFLAGFSFLLITLVLSSCGIYRKRILFQTDVEIVPENMQLAVAEADDNYTLQVNDFVEVEVYTNEGELIIDPNNEIMQEIGAGRNMQQMNNIRRSPQFLIRQGGLVKLPLVGDINLSGLTVYEAEAVLQQEYSNFYEDAFVVLRYTNKRVIVLGSTGGRVIPLTNENTNLIEILALSGGVSTQARVDKIRLIRGNLDDPEVRIINLSTIDGMKNAQLKVISGDIIYVEPVQRIAGEALRDLSPIFGLVSSTLGLILLVNNLTTNR